VLDGLYAHGLLTPVSGAGRRRRVRVHRLRPVAQSRPMVPSPASPSPPPRPTGGLGAHTATIVQMTVFSPTSGS
jgi:hypothetical protein